ncbi:MAG: hypothetical protein ABIQ16_19270 [Polyangiaceae bacterium]
MKHLWLSVAVLAALAGVALGACGGAPERPSASPAAVPPPRAVPKQVAVPDDCEQETGKPPPEPLVRAYTGVAAKARCQREVYTIMGGVTHFLGVQCKYCHLVPDYKAMTHRKEVANWMASELIPALREKDGGKQPWCDNCHRASSKGVAKLLGDPRNPSFAIEWMTTHLVEDFQTKNGSPLHCRSCHQGNLGTPQFERKIILTNHLPSD